MRSTTSGRGALAAAVVAFATGCTPRPLPPPDGPVPPPYPDAQAKCAVAKSQATPLIVEWPSASRAHLEAMARRGVVAIRYEGCEVELMPRCRIAGAYAYSAITPKRDRVTIHDADELYAALPVGAAKLEGKLATSGSLSVGMTIVGRYDADKISFGAHELHGDCARATHIISGLTVGAFRFLAGSSSQASAEAGMLGAGAGAASSSSEELLAEDGSDVACGKSAADDKAPPFGCGAFIRLEVVPLQAPKVEADAKCPSGATWDGKQCVTRDALANVDWAALMQETKAGKAAKAELKVLFDARQKELDKDQDSLRKDQSDFEQQEKIFSADVVATKKADLTAKYVALQQKFTKYNAELAAREKSVTQKVYADLRKWVVEQAPELSKSLGIGAIYEDPKDATKIVWAKPGFDAAASAAKPRIDITHVLIERARKAGI